MSLIRLVNIGCLFVHAADMLPADNADEGNSLGVVENWVLRQPLPARLHRRKLLVEVIESPSR